MDIQQPKQKKNLIHNLSHFSNNFASTKAYKVNITTCYA